MKLTRSRLTLLSVLGVSVAGLVFDRMFLSPGSAGAGVEFDPKGVAEGLVGDAVEGALDGLREGLAERAAAGVGLPGGGVGVSGGGASGGGSVLAALETVNSGGRLDGVGGRELSSLFAEPTGWGGGSGEVSGVDGSVSGGVDGLGDGSGDGGGSLGRLAAEAEASAFRLSGVFSGGRAIVDGRAVGEGERVRGWVVRSIDSDGVLLSRGGSEVVLTMPESGGGVR